jgi:hypothetical protein
MSSTWVRRRSAMVVVEALPTRSQRALGGGTVEEGELAEVGVLRRDHVVVLGGVVPDLSVGRRVEAEGADVGAVGELGREDGDETA